MGLTAKHTAAEVPGPEVGAQQIFARKAGVQGQLEVVVEACGVGEIHRSAGTPGEGIRSPIHRIGPHVDSGSGKGVGSHHKGGKAGQLGGGGKLGGFQLTHLHLQAVHPAPHHGQLLFELLHELLELIGDLGDAVQASIEQGCSLIAGHGPLAPIGAIRVTGHTAVALDQIAQSLISPIRGANVRELVDRCHLVDAVAPGSGVQGANGGSRGQPRWKGCSQGHR
jgi:hypothetical protein